MSIRSTQTKAKGQLTKLYSTSSVGASGGGSGSLWDFSQITGSLWIKANDAATITESGGVISAIADKSIAGNNISQSTSSNRPIYGTQLNAKNTIFFDGTNDKLDCGSSVFDHRAAHTIFLLMQYTVGTRMFPFGNGNAAGTYGGFLDINYASNQFRYQIQSPGVFTPASNTLAVSTYFIMALAIGTTSQSAYINGDFVGNATIGISGGTAPDNFALGSYSVSGSSLFLQGNIAELFIAPSLLSNSNIARGFGYLAHEWGVTSLLPAAYPYKTLPPYI